MKKRRTAEEVRRLLQEFDRDLASGLTVPEICEKRNVAETTYYRWRQQQNPTKPDAAHRHSELESEIQRLNRQIADLTLDKQMLEEVIKKDW